MKGGELCTFKIEEPKWGAFLIPNKNAKRREEWLMLKTDPTLKKIMY